MDVIENYRVLCRRCHTDVHRVIRPVDVETLDLRVVFPADPSTWKYREKKKHLKYSRKGKNKRKMAVERGYFF